MVVILGEPSTKVDAADLVLQFVLRVALDDISLAQASQTEYFGFATPEHWWSIILEQIEDGLL